MKKDYDGGVWHPRSPPNCSTGYNRYNIYIIYVLYKLIIKIKVGTKKIKNIL